MPDQGETFAKLHKIKNLTKVEHMQKVTHSLPAYIMHMCTHAFDAQDNKLSLLNNADAFLKASKEDKEQADKYFKPKPILLLSSL